MNIYKQNFIYKNFAYTDLVCRNSLGFVGELIRITLLSLTKLLPLSAGEGRFVCCRVLV